MTNQEKLEKETAVCDLADKYLDEAIAKGEPFTEGLSDWAFNKARQEVGN